METFSYLDVKTVLMFVIAFLVCYLILRRGKKLPPGPWGLPLVGNVFWFLKHASSTDTRGRLFFKASQTYGDLLYLRIGRQGLLVLHGSDVINDFFVRHADFFSDRPHWISPFLKETLKDGKGLLWQSGEDWRKMRKFVLQSMREFGVGKKSLEEKVFVEIEAASEVFRSEAGAPHDLHPLLTHVTSNVVNEIVFGKRYDYDDDKIFYMRRKIAVLFQKGGVLDLSRRLPNFILKLVGPDKLKEWEDRLAAVRDIRSAIYQEIEEHEMTFDPDNIRDFVDLYLQSKQAGEDKHLFTAGNVFRMILDVYVSGPDTMSLTLLWLFLYMTEYPDVQARCQHEIDVTCGQQDIQWSHRNALHFVQATLMEVQRHSSNVEMSLPHTNAEEITVCGYTIPKRTLVFANLLSSNWDPRHWQQPEAFRPDRFLQDGKLYKNAAFMPFSTGPRVCVAQAMSNMVLFLVFANLLQRFTFSRENDDVPHSFDLDKSQMNATPVAFKVRVNPRS